MDSLTSRSEPCHQPNPWVMSFRLCVRSLGHTGSHRDSIGGRWVTGQELGQEWGAGTADTDGHDPPVPPDPQPTPAPTPLPATSREQELRAQLDQEREAHAHTRRELERALIWAEVLGYHPHQEGPGDQ